RSKAESLAELGAIVADNPADAVSAGDLVIVLLKDAEAIREVLIQPEPLANLDGKTVLQMSTIAPWESQNFDTSVRAAGGSYLEAPVLGSTPQARHGELWVMVGARQEQFESWQGLLKQLGEDPLYIGPVGRAATLKLALNQLLVSLVASFGVSLAMVLRGDVPLEPFLRIVRESSLHSPQFDKKLPRMLERDFSDPHVPVSHMLKDVDLILETIDRQGVAAETQAGLRKILVRALDMGFVEVDYSALYNAINPDT
ncbi:MAG: NAD(P)-dependent oxidoreductase, partial [Anaerolineales bacterium]|nr:NAD(P)-dependent oxidoreductase [Anaerolineales bacterium]